MGEKVDIKEVVITTEDGQVLSNQISELSGPTETEDNERWKSDGNCIFCRRQKYCSKPCTAQKRRKEAILRAIIRNATGSGRLRKTIGDNLDENI